MCLLKVFFDSNFRIEQKNVDYEYDYYLLAIAKLLSSEYSRLLNVYFYTSI